MSSKPASEAERQPMNGNTTKITKIEQPRPLIERPWLLPVPLIVPMKLFHFHFSTGFNKLLLCIFSFLLANTGFYRLRCAVNQVFSLFQAKTGKSTNNFNNA